MKPKLLLTASTFPRWAGDTEPRFILDLAKSLQPYFDITVLAPSGPGLSSKDTIEGVSVIRFRYFPIQRWESLCYPGAIIYRIKQKKIRVLLVPFFLLGEFIAIGRASKHYDLINANWVFPQGVFQSFFRKPYVVTCHGDDIYALNSGPIRALKVRAFRRAAGVIAVSRDLEAIIKSWIPNKEISVQSMGFDHSLFSRDGSLTNLLEPYEGTTILFVGRMAPKKGAEDLIRAIFDLPDTRLVLVGNGPLFAELQEKTQQIRDRVIFLGERTHDELAGIYRACDIFCMPSRREAFGLVSLEAMASGLCVAGSRVGGIQEIIQHEVNGLLFEPGNVEEIKASLIRLIRDPQLRAKLSKAADETVIQYDYPNVGRKYANILMKAIQMEKEI